MARDDEAGAAGQRQEAVEAPQHILEVDDDGEGAAALQVLVEMGGVGGEAEPARLGKHPHRLEPAGMAADAMDGDALGDLAAALVKDHAAPVEPEHGLCHMGAGIGRAERVVAHAGAGRIGHLGGLEVQPGLGEEVQPAGMVVVEMGDDDPVDLGRRQAEGGEDLGRVGANRAAAGGALGGVVAGIDEDRLGPAPKQPDIVVDGPRPAGIGIGDEVERPGPRRMLGVFQREDLPGPAHRCGVGLRGVGSVAMGEACTQVRARATLASVSCARRRGPCGRSRSPVSRATASGRR